MLALPSQPPAWIVWYSFDMNRSMILDFLWPNIFYPRFKTRSAILLFRSPCLFFSIFLVTCNFLRWLHVSCEELLRWSWMAPSQCRAYRIRRRHDRAVCFVKQIACFTLCFV